MAAITDRAEATDSISAELTRDVYWPCPKCCKATKEHHGPGERICSDTACRWTGTTAVPLPLPSSSPFPCSKCGKATKEHHYSGTRICSNKACRQIQSAR